MSHGTGSYFAYPDELIRERFIINTVTEIATCKRCDHPVTCANGSVNAMKKHLFSHNRQDSRENSSQQSVVMTTMELKRWLCAALVVSLHMSFNSMSHPLIRILFWLAKLGTVNARIARQMVDEEFVRVQGLLKDELRELKRQGAVFTLMADEWTRRQKRFVGIILHSSIPIPSLGKGSLELLARFREQGTGENLFVLITAELNTYDLDFQDIYGLTSDAASPMIKLGSLIANERGPKPFYHQTCYAHGIHLAVVDTLKWKGQEGEAANPTTQLPGFGCFGFGAADSQEEEEPPEPSDDDIQNEIEIFDSGHWGLIQKIRNIALELRGSAAKSDQLELICRRNNFRVLKMFLSVNHRWDSTLHMLERFLDLETPLRSYFGSKGQDFPLSAPEMETVHVILPALKIVAEASTRLQKTGVSLLQAETILGVW